MHYDATVIDGLWRRMHIYKTTDGLIERWCATKEESEHTISGCAEVRGLCVKHNLRGQTFWTPVCMKTEISELMIERNPHWTNMLDQLCNLHYTQDTYIKMMLTRLIQAKHLPLVLTGGIDTPSVV